MKLMIASDIHGSEPSYMTLDGTRLCWHELGTGRVYDTLDL